MKRKFVYGLLALLISIGLWLYVVTVVNPEWEDTFYNIPIALENEEILLDRGLMLVSDEKPTVTLRLSGNRADMIKLNSSNITLRADLSRIYSAGEQALSYSIVYPGDVPNNAFEIISQTPQQITLSVAERKTKDVDVEVDFMGTSVPEQYIAFKNQAVLDFEKITVTGPASVVDRVAFAKVEVNLEGLTETVNRQYDYVLCDADGNIIESDWLKTNAEQVLYTLKIQQWKDISLRVDVIDGGGLKKENCTITKTLDTIRVSGSEKLLADLGDELVLGSIDLALIETSQTISFSIPAMPEGVTNLSETSTVDVKVEIPALAIKEFTVTDIVAVNAAGMNVTFNNKEKTVKIRGPQAYVNAVTSKDLKIHVDFTNAEAGMADFKATVVVSGTAAGFVGAVGTYNVSATVVPING